MDLGKFAFFCQEYPVILDHYQVIFQQFIELGDQGILSQNNFRVSFINKFNKSFQNSNNSGGSESTTCSLSLI